MLSDYNIRSSHLTIQLLLPAEHAGAAAETLQIKGRLLYTVLSAGHFRSGIQFVQFEKGSQEVLENYLGRRAAFAPPA